MRIVLTFILIKPAGGTFLLPIFPSSLLTLVFMDMVLPLAPSTERAEGEAPSSLWLARPAAGAAQTNETCQKRKHTGATPRAARLAAPQIPAPCTPWPEVYWGGESARQCQRRNAIIYRNDRTYLREKQLCQLIYAHTGSDKYDIW